MAKNGKHEDSMKELLSERMQQALDYPLFDSIFNRRSRRFGLGWNLKTVHLNLSPSTNPFP